MIVHCHSLNPDIEFEIGTEQSIWRYEPDELSGFLSFLERHLEPAQFAQIKVAVIQSGTSLKNNQNTGRYDAERLADMLIACWAHGMQSKEHNGDWLAPSLIDDKFKVGLDMLNIAPEFGQIETQTYLDAIGSDEKTLDTFHKLCFDSGRWKKWLDAEQVLDKLALIRACGHYVFANPEFEAIKTLYPIDNLVQTNLIKKLEELHGFV